MLHFLKKDFAALTKAELYAILKLRMQIFILEQRSFYLDCDDQDQQATHVLGIEQEHSALICYGRITVEKSTAYIRRVCVHKDFRQLNIGSSLMNEILSYIHTLSVGTVELDAQIHLQAFYEKYGFRSISQPYDDGGIMHVIMQKIIHKI